MLFVCWIVCLRAHLFVRVCAYVCGYVCVLGDVCTFVFISDNLLVRLCM